MSYQGNILVPIYGLNLTTMATGTAAANFNAAPTSFIPQNTTYVQVATCTSTNNALTLPIFPMLNTPLIVRNDGAYALSLFAGSSTSTINGVAGSVVNGQALIGANGGQMTLIALANNQALNTATGSNVYNNPLVTWQIINYSGPEPVVLLPTTFTNAAPYVVSLNQSGATLMVPATMGAAGYIELPASTIAAGANFKIVAAGTVGQIVKIGLTGQANISGIVANNNATVPAWTACSGKSFVNFTATAVVGDQINLVSDGTNWYVNANSQAAAGLSVTA